MTNREIAGALFYRHKDVEQTILSEHYSDALSHDEAEVIYRLLQDDKDSRVYPFVCLHKAHYSGVWEGKKLCTEAIEYFTKTGIDISGMTWLNRQMEWSSNMVDVHKVAKEQVVHPEARPFITGLGDTDIRELNFHDAEILDIRYYLDENTESRCLDMTVELTWTDIPFTVRFTDVITYNVRIEDFSYLSGGYFYLYNGFLTFDAGGIGEIVSRSAEFLNLNDIKPDLEYWVKKREEREKV